MKKIKSILALLVVAATLLSCGASVKVADQWKNENFMALKGEKIVVIHKTENEVSKKRFEIDLVKALKEKGIEAIEMHKAFPDVVYNDHRTEAEVKALEERVMAAGYNGVIITLLKDKDQQIETTSSGGYYSGASYPSYYGRYYGGFGSYYGGVYGHGYGGSYIPPSSTTKVVDIYLLETVSYNIALEAGEELVGVVSVKIEDPQSYSEIAKKYVKIVTDQFED